MTQITIRGLYPVIERKIRRIAKKKGISLNRVILDMVYQSRLTRRCGCEDHA